MQAASIESERAIVLGMVVLLRWVSTRNRFPCSAFELALHLRSPSVSHSEVRTMAMAKPSSSSILFLLLFLYLISLFFNHFSRYSFVIVDSHFEGFEADGEDESEDPPIDPTSLRSPPSTLSYTTKLTPPDPDPSSPYSHSDIQSPPSDLPRTSPSTTAFEFRDEDEFEGLPAEKPALDIPTAEANAIPLGNSSESTDSPKPKNVKGWRSFTIEIVCGSFLIIFAVNYFYGKRENENIALAWTAQFAAKD